MSDEQRGEPTNTSRASTPPSWKMTPIEIGALIFAIVWVLICVVFFFGLGGTEAGTEKNGVGFVVVVTSVLVPIAVVWLAVSAARSARIVTDESERLQETMAEMRKTFLDTQSAPALTAPRPEERTPRLENTSVQPAPPAAAAPAMFATSRSQSNEAEQPAAPVKSDDRPMRDVSPADKATTAPKQSRPAAATKKDTATDAQPSLKLDEAETAPGLVDVDDLIRAINFPENAEDVQGFEALRRTLVDRKVASLIQAAQDVLTLLSQDGIYMDDLDPEAAPANIWRGFARGQRGAAVASLGGIRDRSSLEISARRMKSDPAFRDASLHFLRRFDDVLTDAEPRLDDAHLGRFGTTRTARAFMLLGRATGTFD